MPVLDHVQISQERQLSRDDAVRAVRIAVDTSGRSRRQFADDANVDIGTLGDFLAGKRWPQAPTRRKIEAELGWRSGQIDELVEGAAATEATDVEAAVVADPNLLPEAKEHLLRQYRLLLRVAPETETVKREAERAAEESTALADLQAMREAKRPRR